MNSLSSVSIYNINLSLVIVPQDPPFFSAPISRLAKCNDWCSIAYRSNMAATHASWKKKKAHRQYTGPALKSHTYNTKEFTYKIDSKLVCPFCQINRSIRIRWNFYSTANACTEWCNLSFLGCHDPKHLALCPFQHTSGNAWGCHAGILCEMGGRLS